jgi:radical SAM superfamily enzyme YgiQ (UPF0313 family)
MRVQFVFPDLSSTVTDYTGVLSYGVAQLAAMLRGAGHEVSLYHITRDPTEEEFRARVAQASPDLVAFSAISHYARRLRRWTSWAHEAGGAPVVVGGVHATFAPDEIAALPGVTFTCVGEGEYALLELCEALERGRDPTGIPNLWARRGGDVVRNAPRPIVANLDELPDPDLSVFDVAGLFTSRQGQFTYLMSRGCAYRCTYCAAHAQMNVAPRLGAFWRFLSPARAVEQVRTLLDRHLPGATHVSFCDAILFPNQRWLAEFAPRFRARVGLPISCNMRADRLDEATVARMAEAGVRRVRLGVESGNAHLTREVLQRHLELGDLRRGYALLRAYGIERWSYNIVGLPTETLPQALETVRFNAEIDPELAMAFIFYPYPGTDLHRLCRERGMLTDREYDHYKVGVAIRQPQFRDADVLFVHRFFQRLIRLYQRAGRLPGGLGPAVTGALDRVLASRLLPRATLVALHERHRELRHRIGEWLITHAPWAYRLLGGHAPAGVHGAREGLARADA